MYWVGSNTFWIQLQSFSTIMKNYQRSISGSRNSSSNSQLISESTSKKTSNQDFNTFPKTQFPSKNSQKSSSQNQFQRDFCSEKISISSFSKKSNFVLANRMISFVIFSRRNFKIRSLRLGASSNYRKIFQFVKNENLILWFHFWRRKNV